MAIYLPAESSEIPDTVTPPLEPTPVADIAMPDSTANPLVPAVLGESPWDVEESNYQGSLDSWRKDATTQIDNAALDPDNFYKGKDLSFARDPKQATILATNDAFLNLQNDGEPLPPGDMARALYRQETAIRLFNGAGAESEEAFHGEVVKEAQGRKDGGILGKEMAASASLKAFQIREDKGETQGGSARTTFRDWKEVAKLKPGYDPSREADYFEAWHQIQSAVKEKVDTFRPELDGVWKQFETKGDYATAAESAYYTLSDTERPVFMAALSMRAKSLPDAEQATFWGNFKKQTGRDVKGFGETALDGLRMFSEFTMVANNPEQKSFVEGARIARESIDFKADVARIQQSEYDPMKYLAKDGTWAQAFEKIPYGATGAVVTSVAAAIPGVGMASFLLSTQEGIYQNFRQKFQDGGMDYAQASSMATNLSTVAALPTMLMERLQLKAISGKLPMLDQALTAGMDRISSATTRFGVRALAIGAQEGMLEKAQDMVPALVQDIGNALSEDVPDVQWTGKGGELDGFWKDSVTMIGIMLPLAVFGAAGGISPDRRAAAFSAASTTELQALGIKAEGIAAINAANGQASLNAAVDSAWADRDAKTPEAEAAVEQLKLQHETRTRAQAALEELGYARPSFVQTKEGIFVFDGDGKELGMAPDLSGAIRIARAHTVALDDMEADQVAALGSMMEAAKAAVELDPNSQVSVDLGQFDPETASPEMAARFAAQVALKEQAEGGTGNIARSVLGYSVTSFAQGIRTTINNLFKGAAVTDVFHETFHGLRRQARAAGTVTRADEIALLRALDTILGGKTTKAGVQLRFIPENMTDEQISETLLDEAIGEIAEMELLRTRKGAGKGKLGLTRGVISRNLTALAKLAPGAVKTFKSFMDAVRARWGLSLSRAVALKKAERDGKFDKDGYEAFLDKLLGLDAQVEHDAGVKSEFDRILALPDEMAGDDIPFSIGGAMAEIPDYMRKALSTAQKMRDKGADEKDIWWETRWVPGKYDGKMRWEISDDGAVIKGTASAEDLLVTRYAITKERDPEASAPDLQDIMRHPALYAAYPQAAQIPVIWTDKGEKSKGMLYDKKAGFSGSVIAVRGDLKGEELKSTIIHEVQHWIQNFEGFAQGGSPANFEERDLKNEALQQIAAARKAAFDSIPEEFKNDAREINRGDDVENAAWQRIQENPKAKLAWANYINAHGDFMEVKESEDPIYGKLSAVDQYLSLAGEIEARDVQARMKMSPSERETIPLYSSAKISEKDAIVMQNGVRVLAFSQQSETSFSIGPADVADIMAGNALKRITDPRRRTQVMSRIARDFNGMRLQIDRMASLAGIRRSKRDIRLEAMAREDLAAEEKIAAIHARFGSLLADEDLVKIKSQPVNAFLAVTRPNGTIDPFRGRLKSKAQAIKDSPDMFQLHRVGDYDGSDGVSRSVFGGNLMPDQAAQELYDAHLISAPTADALWEALMVEQNTVAKFREMLVQAQDQIRAAKAEAKQEANEWLATQAKDQEVNFSDKEEIRRSLRMLDAILLALPAEIRGKIGGYTQISMIGSDEARLAYLKDKLEKADKELETYLRVEYAAEWEAMLKKAAPASNNPGERPTGSIAADAYDIFRVAEGAMGMKFAEGEAEADKWDAIADNSETEPADADLARVKAQMVRLTMNWPAADAARREQAVLEGEKIYYNGLLGLKMDASRRRERLNTLRSSAITGTGKDGSRMQRKAAEIAAKSNKGREALQMAWEFLSFGQVVNVLFGEDSAAARWFNARELAASNAFEDAFQAKVNAIESLFASLSGSRFNGEKLQNKMTTVDTIKVTDALGIEQTFTDAEAITFLLMWRQEDGKRHMQGVVDEETGTILSTWAWNDASAKAIEAQLSDSGKAAMAFLAQSYGEEYGRINDVFRRIWNVSMPRHKMYSPLSIMPADGKKDTIMDPVSGDIMGSGMTPGSLKNRSFSAIAEPEFKDAFQVYISHARQMEHFIAYGEFARDALAVVNRRDARTAIAASGGPFAAGVLSKWLDFFAVGGVKDANMGGAIAKTVGGVIGGISQAALVGRVSVLVMQSLQLTAGVYKMPVGAYLTRLTKLLLGRLAWGDAIRSEYIQRRIATMPPIVRDLVQGLSSGTPNRAKYLAAELGKTISGADAIFTGGTYAILYDYNLTLARQAGIANPEAHAHSEAERLTDQVAQPVRTGARSWVEVANQGNASFRAMWSFASDPRQKISLAIYAAMRRDKRGAEKAATVGKALALTWLGSGALAGVLRAAMRDLRDDDDDEWIDERHWSPKRLGLMALNGPLGGIPYLGEIIENNTYKLTGEYMPAGGMLAGLGQSVHVIPKWLDGDIDALKDVEKIFTDAAAVSGTAAALASAMHILRDAWGVIENIEGPD